MEYGSAKNFINQTIEDILIFGRELNGVKNILKNCFEGRLSDLDSLYIEEKYIELLLSKWLQQAPKQTVESIEPDDLLDFTNQLGSIKTFSQCTRFSAKCEYSCLILELYDESPRLQALEDKSVLQFKQSCLNYVQLRIGKVQVYDLPFIGELVNLLKNAVDLDETFNFLKVSGFLAGSFTFEYFITNLLKIRSSDDNITKLQKSVKLCSDLNDSYLIKNLKEIFVRFIKPIDVKEFTADGRRILEVAGTHIVFSKALQLIEYEKKIQEIDEIRFVQALVLHADVNLTNLTWKGKNLVVSSETLIVHNDGVVWDVSGKNGEVSLDGGNVDSYGENGADGIHGESGGNVLILVEELKGGCLTIMSNGGNGSKGLDGRKGADGQDGSYINGLQFKSMFPPVASYFNSTKTTNLSTTKISILNCIKLAKTIYYNDTKFSDLEPTRVAACFVKEVLGDFYINAVTKEECEITFSYYHGNFVNRRQSHLLYKGAPGEQGKPGGQGGRGGCGGFAGDIDVCISSDSNSCIVKCIRNNGKHGADGKCGMDGKPGKRGADCGYIDWSMSKYCPIISLTNPDDDKRLKIKYSEKSSSSSVYCPYKKKYAEIKDYKEEYKMTQNYKFSKHSKVSSKEPLHVARKKTIDLKSMVLQYKTNTFSSFDKLQNSLEMAKHVADDLNNELQAEETTSELKITRQISWMDRTDKRCKVVEYLTQDELDSPPKNESKYKYQGTRYKLKILNAIAKQHFNQDSPETEYVIDSKFLSSIGNDCNKIFSINKQPTDIASKYFCNNSVERVMKTKDLLEQNEDINLSVFIVFIKTHGSLVQGSIADMYLKNYCCFENERENKTNNMLIIPITNLFERSKNNELYTQLCKSILKKDEELFIKLLDNIKKDQFLYKLYRYYQEEASKTFDWSKAIDDEELRKEMSDEIIRGPHAEFYREFLSYIFKVNILYFTVDKNDNITLSSNHNPREKNKLYILIKGTKFYELIINDDITQLLLSQKVRGSLYSKILLHVDSLADKEDLDLYAITSPFNCDNYEGVDKKNVSFVKFRHIINQNSDINVIKRIFNSEDDILITPRLEKLKVEYIGYTNILHYMALHFENDGKSIRTREFCYVLNFILWSALTMPTSVPLVTWIIASSPPEDWLKEITLLKLEMCLERGLKNAKKISWRNFLSNENVKPMLMRLFEKICEKNSSNCRFDQIDEVLHLMSSIPKSLDGLEHIDLGDWIYYLRDKYWLHKLKTIKSWPEDIVNQASLYFVLLENSNGFDKAKSLLDMVIQHAGEVLSEIDRKNILDVLRGLVYKDISLDNNLMETLSNITMDNWISIVKDTCFDSEYERSLEQLVGLIRVSRNTSDSIKGNLSSIEKVIRNINQNITELSSELSNEFKLKQWIQWIKMSLNNMELGSFLEKMLSKLYKTKDDASILKEKSKNVYEEFIMTVIAFAIAKECKGINLRNTQKLAIVMFLTNERNLLAQISTGEGKSLIVVCTAIIKAITGQKVDIITSSHVLAERDAKEYSELYKLFGLSVGHNCSDNVEERKKVYSNCQVVYGELSNFQRDYLLDRAYDKNILGDRKFEILIVDEVDSLLLDRGNNTLYLSHEIPGLDKLEPVFVYIWKWLNTPSGQSVLDLRENILIALGQINKECLRELDSNLTETEVNKIWGALLDCGIISKNGIILKDQIHYDELDKKTKDYIAIIHLKYMFNKVINYDKPFEIPYYLKGFVYRHLDKWIENAQVAMCMENGIQYVVDVNRSGTSSDRSPNITILDNDTGTDQASSQWENGLHQFLQLKHGCKQFSISLKAVFISNVSFIKKYKRLYGLSGTLGTSIERTFLLDLYNVDYVTIPTAKAKQFSEMLPIACKSQNDWINEIFSSVYELVKTRSVLIICESVNDVLSLKRYFNKCLIDRKASIKVNTYTRDYEQLKITENLQPGQIIISTNLAGRGTDIKLSQELIDAGGLHVCLSFLPKNIRVEEQAFGRVARNGQPGSAQMIFVSGSNNSISKTVDLKKQRNLDERHRVTSIKHIYETQIFIEEQHFEKFLQKYSDLKEQMKHLANVKSLLLQISLDKWAYWLDENADNITSVSIDGFINDLSKLLDDDICKDCFIKDPYQLTKLGFVYLQEKRYDTSENFFNKVIMEEKSFSEIAQYYRLYIRALKGLDLSNISDILDDLFKKRISSSLMSSHFIDWLKHHDNNSIMQIDSYKEQQLQKSKIYNTFLQSIYDIIGHDILPSNMSVILQSTHKDLDEFTAYGVYKKSMEKGIIKMPQLKPYQENSLTCMLQYGIHPEEMYRILKENESLVRCIFMKSKGFKWNESTSNLKPLLPSRELFWDELLKNKILDREVEYLFIDFIRLEEEVSYLTTVIGQLTSDVPIALKNSIWLYKEGEIKLTHSSNSWVVFMKCKVISAIGDETYKYLKKKGIVYENKLGIISTSEWWTKPVKFTNFDSLKESDFMTLGIDAKLTQTIISELIELKIIKKSSLLSSTYLLLIYSEDNIKKIQLSKHPAFTTKVQSLLTHHFSFRIAYRKFVYLVTKFGLNGEKLNLTLQCHQHILKGKASASGSNCVQGRGLKENKHENLYSDMSKLKSLLPSRELFWKELLKNNILRREIEYVFIDFSRFEKEVPYLITVINQLTTDIPISPKDSIWLYKKDEIKLTNTSDNWVIFMKCKLMSVIGDEIYKYLKKKGIVYKNKLGIISSQWWTMPVKFTNFDSLKESDFKTLGIDAKITNTIISELKELKIIRECSLSDPTFSLITSEDSIEKLQLSKHPAYTSDVQSLLTHCFSFRIAYKKLLYLVTEFGLDGEKLCLPLQCHLHKSLFVQLQETLITEPKVNYHGCKNLQNIYLQSMSLQEWEDIFNKIFSKSYSRRIVNSLNKCEWLVKKGISSDYYINYEVSKEGNPICSLKQPKPLPNNLQGYTELIEYILINYLKLSNNIKTVEKSMSKYIGEMYSKDTPRFYFKPLLSVLKENYEPTSECSTFELNGLDQLMVVDEQLYSQKMIRNTFLVSMLAITEIAAGAVLMTSPTHTEQNRGGFLISEGMCDLIYGFRCAYSGLFSSDNYFRNKIISLTLSAVSYGYQRARLYRSRYSEKTVVRETENTGLTNVIVKRIVKTGGISLGLGMKTSLINQLVAPQLEKLEEALISIIHSNIDKTIVDHDVIQCVRVVCYRFGIPKTREIIQECFQKVINENKSDFNNNFQNVFNLCQTLMNDCLKELPISNKNDDLDYLLKIADILANFIKMISMCNTCWDKIINVVSELLCNFQQKLEYKLANEQHQTNVTVTEKDCNHFILVSTESWKKGIQKLLCNSINEIIVSPLLKYSSNKLCSQLFQYSLGKSSFFSDKEIQDLAKLKPKLENDKISNLESVSDKRNFVDTEYDKLLLNLLKKDRHASILSEMSKRNFPVDGNCIEICCEIVPTLLKKEGIEIPPVKIVLDIDGIQRSYNTAPEGSNLTTVYLSPDESILTNILHNRSLCIKTIVHQISKSVCPPKFLPYLDAAVNNILSETGINESIPTLSENRKVTFNKPSTGYIGHINTECENTLPYQHKGWRFKSYVDVDLREKRMSLSDTIEDYVLKGFDAALLKINQHISTVLMSTKLHIKLSLQDFSELSYEIWPKTEQSSNFPFHCQPVCYELVMPLPIDTIDNVCQFVITMRFNSRLEKRATNRPQGAHILYEMRPFDTTGHLEKSMTGHVLLNAECERVNHSIDKCIVAGELIVPTGFTYPLTKEDCDVLIIGDRLFKKRFFRYIVKHSKFKCKFLKYQKTKLTDIKQEVVNACKLYKGIRCVVLYIATEGVDLTDNAVVIGQTISDTVLELQSHLGGVNIILCSLRIKKQENHPEIKSKREEINQYLFRFCEATSFSYLNLNEFNSIKCRGFMDKIKKIGDSIIKEISQA